MCRNIRVLNNFEPPATPEEIRAAALQFVRKVSGSSHPAQVNREAFERAVDEITAITQRLIEADLVKLGPPRSREKESEKARKRGRQREDALRRKVLAEGG
jgi:hypothetical protein